LVYNQFPIVLIASAIKILKLWIEERYKRMELEIQNQSSELALLRNQINPHFLFNTLNNIHTLITKDSNKAADALMRLSDIMRYMLYETNTELVPLENEIEYIQSYIELQKLRLANPQKVIFDARNTNSGFLIAPMLLIPFIENAFKHSEKNSNTAPISIKLESNAQIFRFELSNPIRDKQNESLDSAGGIGLKNVNRRLELIYPNRHSLNISSLNNIFNVQLTLNV
jgi:LytS/YehU family sensor histidine kinase